MAAAPKETTAITFMLSSMDNDKDQDLLPPPPRLSLPSFTVGMADDDAATDVCLFIVDVVVVVVVTDDCLFMAAIFAVVDVRLSAPFKMSRLMYSNEASLQNSALL